MVGRDLDDAQEWVASWSTSVSRRAERAQRLAARVADLSATASGADGLVEVRVDSSGAMTGLHLGDGVSGWPAARIEREILTTMRAAQARLTAQVTAVVNDTVGTDTETGRAVVSGYAERFSAVPDDSAGEGGWRDR